MAFTPAGVAGIAHTVSVLNGHGSAPANGATQAGAQSGTPGGTTNPNLSLAQFSRQARAVSHISDYARSALGPSSSSVPNVADPSYSPPNSIKPGLYT